MDTTGDGAAGRIALPTGIAGALLHATLWVTPYPAARALRRRYAEAGVAANLALEEHGPDDVEWWFDEAYGPAGHEVYDLYRPFDPEGGRPTLPAIVWLHGGGFVGGDKAHRRGWGCRLASAGFAVLVPVYSLAPEVEYPTPVQQVVDLLGVLARDAARTGIDPGRLVLAGDGAGAQIAAQVAAVVSSPDHADECGVEVPYDVVAPLATVLCGGPYDLSLVSAGTDPRARTETCCLWSYSGSRVFRSSREFATWSVVDHVTAAFPPALLTVADDDPLAPHTAALARALEAQGVVVEQVASAAPASGPVLERIVEFARAQTAR